MTQVPDADWVARGVGACAGALISLVYLLPKGPREAVCRFVAGIVCGVVFGGTAGVALADWVGVADQISASETLLMGSAAASLSAWWMLGALSRVAERWGRRNW